MAVSKKKAKVSASVAAAVGSALTGGVGGAYLGRLTQQKEVIRLREKIREKDRVLTLVLDYLEDEAE